METTITLSENIKLKKEDMTITVEGPNATLKKTFAHPRITISQKDNIVKIKTDSAKKKDKASLGTWTAHLKNMIKGAEKDYEYHLKILYTHFPMTLKQDADAIIITNFMGEKGTRKAHIKEDVKVNLGKEEITITGPSKEKVGQTAANLEQACRVKNKDIRIYQDGIYITKKG
ncbi:MAG: 50S ribosomal protein L6 [Candidatus Nanohalarchaeota archaeon]|nr:MAG: 50S ribosomal protein L6 [Candidatus Nanohaloarchaeota archaeon]